MLTWEIDGGSPKRGVIARKIRPNSIGGSALRPVPPGTSLTCTSATALSVPAAVSQLPAFPGLRARGLHCRTKTTTLSKTGTSTHLAHHHLDRVVSLLERRLDASHPEAASDQHPEARTTSSSYTVDTPLIAASPLGAVAALTETRPPLTNQQLGLRPMERLRHDAAHAIEVKKRPNA